MMDANLERRLVFNFQCRPRTEYVEIIDNLTQHYPSEAQTIRDIYQDFRSSHNILTSIRRIAGSNQFDYRPPSIPERNLCRSITTIAEYSLDLHPSLASLDSAFEEGLYYFIGGNRSFPIGTRFRTVIERYYSQHPSMRQRFQEFTSFYRNLLLPSSQVLQQAFQSDARWSRRLACYSSRNTPIEYLRPQLCSNDSEWIRHDVSLSGIRYAVPLFFPRIFEDSWTVLEPEILQVFETFRLLAPQDIERVLRPGVPGSDMAIFVGRARLTDDYSGAEQEISQCSDVARPLDFSGLYLSYRNSIFVRPTFLDNAMYDSHHIYTFSAMANFMRINDSFSMFRQTSDSRVFSGTFLHIFSHEFGHAIYHNLLRDQDVLVLGALRDVLFVQCDRSVSPCQQQFAVNFPNIGPHFQTALQASTNGSELFADMFMEYHAYEVDRALGTALNNLNPHRRARFRIMENLFQERGINLNALSYENVEAAYRVEGIEIHLVRFTPIPP